MTEDLPRSQVIIGPADPMQYSFIDAQGQEVSPGKGIVQVPSSDRVMQKAQQKLFALKQVRQLLQIAQRKELSAPHHAKVKAKRRKKNKMAAASRKRNR